MEHSECEGTAVGSVGKVTVCFRLIGDSLDPALNTGRLGLIPTAAHAKGEMSSPGPVTGQTFRHHTGVWRLKSALPRTAALEQHLSHLLDQLDVRTAEIQVFRAMGYKADFFCGCFLDSWNEGTELSPETLGRVAALGATLALDIYGAVELGDTEDEGAPATPPRLTVDDEEAS